MKAFTIQLRKDAQSKEDILIMRYVELVQRPGKEGMFPIIPLGSVSKRPDETSVTDLPDKFLKVNIYTRKNQQAEVPAYIEQIQISTMDDHGRRFGLWDPRFRVDDPDAPAFIYLAPTDPEARTRFSNASELMYDGLLTEGYNYHPEMTVNKKGIAGFMFSCPSFLIAEQNEKYSIDHFNLKEQCREVYTFHFDGEDIIVDHIEKYEPVKPKKESDSPVQFQYVNSVQALKEEARKRRAFLEKKKQEQAKAKRDAETRKCYSTSPTKIQGDGTLAGALTAAGLQLTPDPEPEPEEQQDDQELQEVTTPVMEEVATEQEVQEDDTQEPIQEPAPEDDAQTAN